jgi:HSP20 family molecular chaperone IbpA
MSVKSKAAASENVRIAGKPPECAARGRSAVFQPLAELIENDDGFEIIAAVPGCRASHLAVDVLPDAIVIEGDRDVGQKLLCRLHLPCGVQTRKTAAYLDHGRLTITAPKQGHSVNS